LNLQIFPVFTVRVQFLAPIKLIEQETRKLSQAINCTMRNQLE